MNGLLIRFLLSEEYNSASIDASEDIVTGLFTLLGNELIDLYSHVAVGLTI
jgi:hypothetical protein